MVSIGSKLKEIRMVGLVEVRRCKGRVVGFLKLQEPSGGTQLAARRHTRDVHGVLFTKNVVFCTFCGTGTARRNLRDLWALGATIFFWFAQFS